MSDQNLSFDAQAPRRGAPTGEPDSPKSPERDENAGPPAGPDGEPPPVLARRAGQTGAEPDEHADERSEPERHGLVRQDDQPGGRDGPDGGTTAALAPPPVSLEGLRHTPFLPLAHMFLTGWRDKDAPTLRRHRGDFYHWRDGRYQPLGREEVDREVLNFLAAILQPEEVNPQLVQGVHALLKSLTLVGEEYAMPVWLDGRNSTGPDRRYVAMANGVLDLEALFAGRARKFGDVLLPPSPLWFSRTVLSYEFDPAAECPLWTSVLDRVLEEDRDRIALLQEWFGYNLVADTSHQKLLILVGEGNNGKSLVCNTLTELLGPENVSGVPLEAFGSRFGLYPTLGKLANVVPEVGELDRVAEGVLKAFTGGDYMTYDRKNRDPIQERPTARLIISTNNLPRFSDRSQGVWRRILLLPFQVNLPPEEVDLNLADKLRVELPGIFIWALAGLMRLRRRGRFTEPAVSLAALREYRDESNPTGQFLEGATSAGGQVGCSELYDAYRTWVVRHGNKPLAIANFSRELKKRYPAVERRLTGGRKKRRWVYDGVTLDSDFDSI